MKLQTKLSAIFDRITGVLAFMGASLIIFTMLIVCTEIVVRYYLGHSIEGTLEITEYALVYMTFLGAAWLLKKEGHVKMDFVLNRLKPRGQVLLNIITSILGVVSCFILTWYSAEVTWDSFRINYHLEHQILEPPFFPIVMIAPIGSLLLSIQFLIRTYSFLRRWRITGDEG